MTVKGWRLVSILFFSIVLAMFLAAPMMCPYGSVTGLSGKPVSPDYFDLWSSLPPLPGFVYAIGDILCHQETARSFVINGNQLPICVRDFSALLGLTFGLAISTAERLRVRKPKYCVIFLFVSFGLMIADVAIQNVFSLNVFPTRIITGLMCGASVALAIDLWLRNLQNIGACNNLYK